jgi:hypothetical protein
MEVKHRSNEKVSNYFAEMKGDASFLDFTGYDGIATTAEKTAAERGAAARGTIGAKRDKCKKGKSCGAACIFYRKDCILELPEEIQSAVRDARNFIMSQALRGKIGVEDAEKSFLRTTGFESLRPGTDVTGISSAKWMKPPAALSVSMSMKQSQLLQRHKEMRAEIDAIRQSSSSKKEADEKIKHALSLALLQGHTKREEASKVITPEMMDGLKSAKQQARFRELNEPYEKTKAGTYKTNKEFNDEMQKTLSWYWKREVSDSEVRLFLAALPTEISSRLLEKGEIGKGSEIPYWGTATPGRNTPTMKRPDNLTPEQHKELDAMGKQANRFLIAKTFLESNGLDAYTRRSVQIMEADVDHAVPKNLAGEMANSGSNRVLTASLINSQKSNLSFADSLYSDSGSAIYKTGPKGGGGTGASPKRTLIKEVEGGTRRAAEVLATASGLPTSAFGAKEWRELNSAIISSLSREGRGDSVSQAVHIGKTGKSTVNTQGWFLFGGKEASGWDSKVSAELGSKAASKLAEWQDQGPEGARKSANLVSALLGAQRQALAINNDAWGNSPDGTIRQVNFSSDPQAKRYVEGRIKEVMESNLPAINEALSQ